MQRDENIGDNIQEGYMGREVSKTGGETYGRTIETWPTKCLDLSCL